MRTTYYTTFSVLVCLGLAGVAAGQSSIGFSEPHDLQALLDYRLPDWGWRTWDVSGEMWGAGHHRNDDVDDDANESFLALESLLATAHESEVFTWSANVDLSGTWWRARYSSGNNVGRMRELDGQVEATGELRRYLAGSSWFGAVEAGLALSYEEQYTSDRYQGDAYESLNVRGGHGHYVQGGVGRGRLRDVTPLLRAERLSERLVALGRPRLTGAQVREVAEVLAREYGYRQAFARPERRFWHDVLEPLLDGPALSVAEIFYLADVLQEDLGARRQGTRWQISGYWEQGGTEEQAVYVPGYGASFETSHNLSLPWQVSAGVTCWRWWENGRAWDGDYDIDNLETVADVSLLWLVADRVQFDAGLKGRRTWQETELSGATYTHTAVHPYAQFNVFIEDHLVFEPYLRGLWSESVIEGATYPPNETVWSWSYGFTFTYRLDTMLF